MTNPQTRDFCDAKSKCLLEEVVSVERGPFHPLTLPHRQLHHQLLAARKSSQGFLLRHKRQQLIVVPDSCWLRPGQDRRLDWTAGLSRLLIGRQRCRLVTLVVPSRLSLNTVVGLGVPVISMSTSLTSQFTIASTHISVNSSLSISKANFM
jgi:hypothetical protein